MGAKAYRIQIYPSRVIHALLREEAERSGLAVSRVALAMIERAMNEDTVIKEIRSLAQHNEASAIMDLIAANLATTDFLLKRSLTDPVEFGIAKDAIQKRTREILEALGG